MLYPKPKIKKHRAKNNLRPTDQDRCDICKKPFAHQNEVFGGINRQNSIKYNMQVRLCEEHHTGDKGFHFNKEMRDYYHKLYQEKFEAEYGHEKFMSVFGRNYI